ncbi:nucleoside-diphosphate-sugar epimerase [Nitrobacteraceae bacterium AZCC 1564]
MKSLLLALPVRVGLPLVCAPGTWYRPDGANAEQIRKGGARIIGDGTAVWSFVHIDDAIAATVAAITAEPGHRSRAFCIRLARLFFRDRAEGHSRPSQH